MGPVFVDHGEDQNELRLNFRIVLRTAGLYTTGMTGTFNRGAGAAGGVVDV